MIGGAIGDFSPVAAIHLHFRPTLKKERGERDV
jgi:hypothetical protein